MATTIRALVSNYQASDPAQTAVVNVVHFQQTAPELMLDLDWQNLADAIRDVFRNYKSPILQSWLVKLYNVEDAEPRPIRAQSSVTLTGTPTEGGPREVALCLSFFSDRNLPRQRGRLYLGPWPKSRMGERPDATTLAEANALGVSLANVGGVDIDWGVWSSMDNAFRKATHKWVDNEWDTIRSRGLEATTRVLTETGE